MSGEEQLSDAVEVEMEEGVVSVEPGLAPYLVWPFETWEEIREITRCTGHCCRAFALSMSPVEIGQDVIRMRRNRGGEDAAPAKREDDLEWIATSLVYLGESEGSPSGMANIIGPPDQPPKEPDDSLHHWYRCRHFKDDSCGIYDTRPPVCRNYPYRDNECKNPGCTRRAVMASGLSWPRVVVEEVVLKGMR